MQRLESPFPPHHRRCLVGGTLLAPSVVAGLLDGDGFAGVERVTTPGTVRLRPYLGIGARDDDATPFAVFRTVHASLGRPLGAIFWDPRRQRNVWRVTRVRDLVEVIDWLGQHPPLGLGLRLRILEVRDVAMASIHQRGGTDDPSLTRSSVDRTRSWAPSGQHFRGVAVGLIATNGYIGIRDSRSRYAAVLHVAQSTGNRHLLEQVRDATGIGTIEAASRRGGLVAWAIRRRRDADRLMALLAEEPLPPSSPKCRQLVLWSQAWLLRGDRSLGRLDAGRPDLDVLVEGLRAAKRRAPRTLLCSCPPDDGDS
jgi:hypothetical protein